VCGIDAYYDGTTRHILRNTKLCNENKKGKQIYVGKMAAGMSALW
jgi:hypothetical protein